jgi:hypothetical protein
MADPTPVVRINPSSVGEIPLYDGHGTLITINGDPDIAFWEKEVQPPGIAAGDEIDTSTMFNTLWRTKIPGSLISMTEITLTAAYDPVLYTQILSQINTNQGFTITFSDGSTVAIWAFLKDFTPQTTTEGEQPVADLTIVATNWDPDNAVEAGPAVSETTGT